MVHRNLTALGQERFRAQCTSFAGMEQGGEAKASDGERNLSVACDAMMYKGDRIIETSDQ